MSEVTVAFASQAEADAATAASRGRDSLWPPECLGQVAGPLLPSPEEVALTFWRQVQLPAPAPEIDPGFAVTGRTAYLESNSVESVPFSFDTVLGPLRIEAEAELTVDWGDGRGPQRYSSVGGPWPQGDVTNVYGQTGAVDVVVSQEWVARWTVAGQGGQLGGLSTSGTIPNFEIRQIQAVID